MELHLWTRFTDFLEGLVRDFGLVKLLAGLASLFAVLAAVGVAANFGVLLAVAVISLFAALLLTVLAQYIDRVRLYREKSLAAEVLDRYGEDLIARQHPDSFTTLEWDEAQTIKLNGDTIIERWLTLGVGVDSVATFWQKAYPDNRNIDIKRQKKVRVEARLFDEDRSLGVSLPVTTTWEAHALRMYFHLYEKAAPSAVVRVYVRISWPRYSQELVEGQVATFEWRMRRKCDALRFKMTIPSKVGDSSLPSRTPIGTSPLPTTEKVGAAYIVTYEMLEPPANSSVGFRLQLTKV